MPKRIVIIGAHAAGVEAASAAKRTDRTAAITLVTREKHAGYSRCGLPFVIGGQIPTFEDLMVFPRPFFQMMKVDLRTETEVVALDVKNRTADVQNKKGEKETLDFDSLILATGAFPYLPPIAGVKKKGIHSLRTLEDGERIDRAIKNGAKTAVVMGGGLIGLETAVALRERGLKVKVVELLTDILPNMFDVDMASRVKEMLEQKGITILTGKRIEELQGKEKVASIIADGEEINGDLFIGAFGVRPNTQLATKAGIQLGVTKAIKTNARMETNVKDIYAAGDCAETNNIITHQPTLPGLGTVAVREGKTAGINAANGYSLFTGALGSAVSRLFDTECGVTGLTETTAKNAKLETVTGTISSKTRAEYYPRARPIRVKLVFEKESQRIIGAQIIGGEEVTQRINAISIAVQRQMCARDLSKADTAYAPPVCETWEPFVLAAEMAVMKLR